MCFANMCSNNHHSLAVELLFESTGESMWNHEEENSSVLLRSYCIDEMKEGCFRGLERNSQILI